jgi:enoyl-CoA hydratase/carnithine racemase
VWHPDEKKENTGMSEQLVILERFEQGQVALLTLNRPEALNALSRELMQAIDAALDEASDSRVLIITGGGRAFAAGADIAQLAPLGAVDVMPWVRQMQDLYKRIEALPQPVIAAVNGLALGGGCELVLACDLVLAAESARFGVPEIKIGVIPGAGGTQRLTRLLGRNRAKQWLMFGEPVAADRACEAGLVNHVVADAELLDLARQWATTLCSRPALALEAAKTTANIGPDASLAVALEVEMQCLARLFASQDKREGMAAFVEKRPPVFRGE